MLHLILQIYIYVSKSEQYSSHSSCVKSHGWWKWSIFATKKWYLLSITSLYSVVSKYPAKPWSTELQDTLKRRHWYLLLFISKRKRWLLGDFKTKQWWWASLFCTRHTSPGKRNPTLTRCVHPAFFFFFYTL